MSGTECRRDTTADDRREGGASGISFGCVLISVVAGSVGFAVADLVATLTSSHVESDVEVGVAGLLLSPFIALLNACICLPLVALANRFWFSGANRNGRDINRHTLGFALVCYIAVVGVCAIIAVPPGVSIFSGHALSADLIAAPRGVGENAWTYLVSGSVAVAVYGSAARWAAKWSVASKD